MEPNKRQIPKKLLLAASLLVLALSMAAGSMAWLSYQRSLRTITVVSEPVRLYIRAGNAEDAARLYLGDIDVEGDTQYADYVFCVQSESAEDYILQLAHTTNIAFTYTVYQAKEVTKDEGAVAYEAADGNTYYYTRTSETPVSGTYLNLGSDSSASSRVADSTYHEITYDTYDHVQKNAEPLYWQATVTPDSTVQQDDLYTNYFILRISWDQTLKNDKETDIIYLTAGRNTTRENDTTQ